MKKAIGDRDVRRMENRNVSHIPIRFILALLFIVAETLAMIAIVMVLCRYVPYFYLAVWATEVGCVVNIIASDDNPDYKIPWLIVVLVIPVAGFMLYFLFYSRTLDRKYRKRREEMKNTSYTKDDTALFEALKEEHADAYSQAKMLTRISEAHLFTDTGLTYFPLGEKMYQQLLTDLRSAEKFIFMEYFIIEEGLFWNSVLEILKEKAAAGVEVKVLYDDIGCMRTLPGNYFRTLKTSYGIDAAPFSALRGKADNEFNNRSHRKITVIDGKIGYTGGVNIADEYINQVVRFGHWKDIGIRLEGDAVKELTKLFFEDFGLNVKTAPVITAGHFPEYSVTGTGGYLIPFGDGPSPVYRHRVGKSVILNMASQANRYLYIMTPYLIIDNELCQCLENTALRGVDVRIIVPHIPDKKLIFEMTKSYYKRLTEAGVTLYEYEPGFIHAKCYLADDEICMIGTINLDYRSLVHHFENGVWMYHCNVIRDIRQDFTDTMDRSLKITPDRIRTGFLQAVIRSLVKVFSPML